MQKRTVNRPSNSGQRSTRPGAKVDLSKEMLSLERGAGGTTDLLPKGVYRFVVDSITPKEGAKGRYYNLKLVERGRYGNTVWWKLFTSEGARRFKDQFLNALEEPDKGVISVASLRGRSVWAKVKIGGYQNGSEWVDQNEIDMFVTPAKAAQLVAEQEALAGFESDTDDGDWDQDDTEDEDTDTEDEDVDDESGDPDDDEDEKDSIPF